MLWTALAAVFVAGGIYAARSGGAPNAGTTPAKVTSRSVRLAAQTRVNGVPGFPRLMLAGNSIALFLTPGFQATGGLTVFDGAILGCAFPPNVSAYYRNLATHTLAVSSPCHPAGEVDELAAFRPRLVVWAVSDAPEPWSYEGRTLHACSSTYDALYTSALRAEITRLGQHGAQVVISTEAYARFTEPGEGVGAVAVPDRTTDCNNALRRQVAAQMHVALVDLFGYTCPHGHCLIRRDGVVLRPDGVHYSGAGAEQVAWWILGQVLQ